MAGAEVNCGEAVTALVSIFEDDRFVDVKFMPAVGKASGVI